VRNLFFGVVLRKRLLLHYYTGPSLSRHRERQTGGAGDLKKKGLLVPWDWNPSSYDRRCIGVGLPVREHGSGLEDDLIGEASLVRYEETLSRLGGFQTFLRPGWIPYHLDPGDKEQPDEEE